MNTIRRARRSVVRAYHPRPCLVCEATFTPDGGNVRVCERSSCQATYARLLPAATLLARRKKVAA